MTRRLPLAVLALLLGSMVLGVVGVSRPALAGGEELADLGPAPEFELRVYGGGQMALSDALERGPVILDFWATWCGPCRKALPRYQAIYERHGEQGLQILAVSQDDPRSQSKIGAFFRSQQLAFPALLDGEKKVGRLYGVQSLPVTFLISREGRIVARHVGYRDGDERVLERQVVELLGADPGATTPEPEPDREQDTR